MAVRTALIRVVKISEINPAPYNPRIELNPGDERYERIKRSLEHYGLVSPLVWNEATGNLVGGHQRLKILKNEGHTEVEVSVVNMSETDEKSLNLVLNSPDIQGEWAGEALQRLLGEIEQQAPDVFDTMELSLLGKLDLGDEDVEVDVDQKGSSKLDDGTNGPPAMELMPYEHYDYIVLMFKDSRDYIAALDHFQLKKVAVPSFVGSKKIGLARVIDGAKYVDGVRRKLAPQSTVVQEGEVAVAGAGSEPPADAPVPVDNLPADTLPGDPIADVDQSFAEAEAANKKPGNGKAKK